MDFENLLKKISAAAEKNSNVMSFDMEIKTEHKTITIKKEISDPCITVRVVEEYSL